jgi:hypothetical protein
MPSSDKGLDTRTFKIPKLSLLCLSEQMMDMLQGMLPYEGMLPYQGLAGKNIKFPLSTNTKGSKIPNDQENAFLCFEVQVLLE